MMIELLFGVLLQGLKVWSDKDAAKHLNKVYSLKSEWLSEYSKPRGERNNGKLDEIESELYLIARVYAEHGEKK